MKNKIKCDEKHFSGGVFNGIVIDDFSFFEDYNTCAQYALNLSNCCVYWLTKIIDKCGCNHKYVNIKIKHYPVYFFDCLTKNIYKIDYTDCDPDCYNKCSEIKNNNIVNVTNNDIILLSCDVLFNCCISSYGITCVTLNITVQESLSDFTVFIGNNEVTNSCIQLLNVDSDDNAVISPILNNNVTIYFPAQSDVIYESGSEYTITLRYKMDCKGIDMIDFFRIYLNATDLDGANYNGNEVLYNICINGIKCLIDTDLSCGDRIYYKDHNKVIVYKINFDCGFYCVKEYYVDK